MRKEVKKKFSIPHDLRAAAEEYLEYCKKNPILKEKQFMYQGEVIIHHEPLPVAPSLQGFRVYTGLKNKEIKEMTHRGPEWAEAIEWLMDAMHATKFEYAACGVLNPNVIIRDLGLKETTEVIGLSDSNAEKTIDEDQLAIHIHPDDPDPLNLPRPLYSKAQIEAGVPFTPPRK